jgi:hypothetical protein
VLFSRRFHFGGGGLAPQPQRLYTRRKSLKRITRRALLAAVLYLGLQQQLPAAAAGPARLARGSEIWNRTELYFGSAREGLPEVTEEEFQRFVNDEVTKRFPDGLTLLTGFGQFKNSTGVTVKETSRVLILFYPPQTLDANKKIQEIRELYKGYYKQESVLRVDSLALISF